MDKNTLENSTVQSVEKEYQNERNSSQEWALSRHSAHQQILQFLKNQGPLTICMGHVPEIYQTT
jgi:flagellar motor switch protein FliG